MKSLVIALGALALSFALTVIAAAQEAAQQDAPNEAAPNPAQATAPDNSQPRLGPTDAPESVGAFGLPQRSRLPLAEAKKRYLDAQKRLQDLVKDGSLRPLGVVVKKADNDLEIIIPVHEPRDRLRAAVAADFDARRQLQQAELADLEARVARIKRALAIRDAIRDTLIDQRTDKLLEQMEEGAQKGKRGTSAAPGDGNPRLFREARPGLPDEAKESPAGERTAGGQVKTKTGTELKLIDAEIELQAANANLAAAKNLYEYSKKMHAKGYVTELDVESKSMELQRAKLQVERAKTRLKALSPAGDDAITNEKPN